MRSRAPAVIFRSVYLSIRLSFDYISNDLVVPNIHDLRLCSVLPWRVAALKGSNKVLWGSTLMYAQRFRSRLPMRFEHINRAYPLPPD